jgi:hypothetical protein
MRSNIAQIEIPEQTRKPNLNAMGSATFFFHAMLSMIWADSNVVRTEENMMKALACLLFLVLAAPAFSSESVQQSRFHLLTTRCEVDSDDHPESTPQSPPLEVDDPATPGCNRWEINIVVGGDITRSQANWELPLLDINYGIGDNIQLKYELPYLNSVSQGSSASAIGESRAGIKYMFFEDERTEMLLAVYPQLSFVQSNSTAVIAGLANPGSIVTLPVLMAMKIGNTARGNINLTANLAYNISNKADTANFLSASVGIGTPILDNVAIMGELTTEQAVAPIFDDARAQLIRAGLGVMTTINRQFMLFGAVGHSLITSDTQDHTYALAGIRLLAGGTSSRAERVAAK